MKKEIKLNTHDIQKLTICVIFSRDATTVTEEDRNRYLQTLAELNNRCNKENDYTLSITVDDGKE